MTIQKTHKKRTKNAQKTHKKRRYKKIKGGQNKIIKLTDENFKFVKKINEHNIYFITIDDLCTIFISIPEKYDYILIKYLENDDKFTFYIYKNPNSSINNNDFEIFLQHTELPIMTIRKIFVNKIDIIPIIKKKSDCKIEIINAQNELINLNSSLQQKCNNLNLKLDYLHNFDDNYTKIETFSNGYKYLLLALCNNNINKCISTIEIILNTEKNIITFNSKTDKDYEGKKYNKLLRSIIIIISRLLMTNVEIIKSDAINPISAWLLLNYFNAVIPTPQEEETNTDFFDFFRNKSINISDINFETLNEFAKNMNNDFELVLHIPINNKNIKNAEEKFTQILKEIKCQ